MSSQWMDFNAIKQSVSLEQVLGHYGLKLRKVNQNSLRGKCPLPTHTSEKGGQSFAVDLQKKCLGMSLEIVHLSTRWGCGGNQLDLVCCMEAGARSARRHSNWQSGLTSGRSGMVLLRLNRHRRKLPGNWLRRRQRGK